MFSQVRHILLWETRINFAFKMRYSLLVVIYFQMEVIRPLVCWRKSTTNGLTEASRVMKFFLWAEDKSCTGEGSGLSVCTLTIHGWELSACPIWPCHCGSWSGAVPILTAAWALHGARGCFSVLSIIMTLPSIVLRTSSSSLNFFKRLSVL